MAATDHGTAVQLGPQDVLAGLALSEEANWNQTEDDWRFFLRHGTVLGIRDAESRVVATAALLPYSAGVAWISMVLVTASWRRRGLATGLLNDCLTLAEAKGLTPRLDATPAGARVYGPMGFTPTLAVRRLALKGHPGAPSSATPEFGSDAAFDELLARDRRAMGFDRGALLGELYARPGSRLIDRDGALALVRNGRKARHIGPLFADHPQQALALIEAIVRSETGPHLIDAVDRPGGFIDGLTAAGWSLERPFQRMRFGIASGLAPLPPMAGAGPEYG
jgi:GNAT superfamily N-acetyltransferase